DRNLLLVDAESGAVLVKLCFEGQSAVLCALWYSEDNVIVGCCNGYLYEVCFKPTNKEFTATMSPVLHRMSNQVRWLAFDAARRLLAVAYGNTVALYVQNNPGRLYLPSRWELLEVVKAPNNDPCGLVHAMFFYPTDKGANNLFIGYAKLGWNVWSGVATVARVSSDTNYNVCNIGRASLTGDQKSIVVSTLDHSIATYTLGNDGPNLSSFKEYPYKDVEDLSLVVPVASTSDGITLGGTTYGEVPMIEGTNGELSLIRHDCDNTVSPVFVTASEALSGWNEADSRWEVAPEAGRMWGFRLSRRGWTWMLFSLVILVFVLSADPPGGPSFEEAKKESYGTELFKPTLKHHEYWVVFGIRHFIKFTIFQLWVWVAWMVSTWDDIVHKLKFANVKVNTTSAFVSATVRLLPEAGNLAILGMGKWMCERVQVYRELGVCPKLEY
ncbi:hypothetical protein FRC08_015941, partial [Ceratobasidium sp. 394]